MRTKKTVALVVGVLLAAGAFLPAVAQDDDEKLKWNGTIYTKLLWGDQRDDGSLYNFTTIPGEGYADNGQGSEFELFLSARVSRQVEVSGRIKARFNQNFWTNFGGFGDQSGGGDCTSGDCGEFDSRSAQYMKFRGATVTLMPDYKYLQTVVVGSNDFGMFDSFTIGKIRYIDRDNGAGVLFQGSSPSRKFSYDVVRVSLPRLWAGPNFSTGDYNVQDASYGGQLKFRPTNDFEITGIFNWVNDVEIDAFDRSRDNGRDLRVRYRNRVAGAVVDWSPTPIVDVTARYYDSVSETTDYAVTQGVAPGSFFGLSGFSPVPAGRLEDQAWKLNLDFNDPFDVGLSFSVEAWDFGADYVSLMAARREQDVLLTEGFDSAWAFPGPTNAAFGVFGGNPTRIGYGGWQGNAQQVVTINVDNEFTDFDEPMAETATGWKGVTIVPTWSIGDLNLSAELTYIDYNQNWQAFDDPSRSVTDTIYPVHELDTGVGHNFRTAYAPFTEKETNIYVLKADYLVDIGSGLELFGKIKKIDEEDLRLNDAQYLPYVAGDCPGGGVACGNVVNNYFDDGTDQFSTASIYGNPGVITVGTDTGYQWKPFDSISDDDRDMDYTLIQFGAGYQVTNQLYGQVIYENYDVDLMDGNTAFQAYQLHEMASGQHDKNKVIVNLRYSLTGTEFGLTYEHNWGEFTPDFGGGFVPQLADQGIEDTYGYAVGTLGFSGRFGGWNSLEKREISHDRLKAYLKVQF